LISRNLISRVGSLVNQYGDTITQVSTSFKSRASETYGSQVKDITDRVTALQSTLSVSTLFFMIMSLSCNANSWLTCWAI
jgi:hypothetical protein